MAGSTRRARTIGASRSPTSWTHRSSRAPTEPNDGRLSARRSPPVLLRRSKMNTTIPEPSSVVGLVSRNLPRTVPDATAVDRAPRLLLRAEAALVLAGAIISFHHLGGSWWVFAALFIAPDLSFIGYVAGIRTGAKVYNAVHTYLAPAALALAGVV